MADLRRRSLTVPTALGWLCVEVTKQGVASLNFCRGGRRGRLPYNLTRALQRYAAGHVVRFKVPLDLSAGTPFQRSVWRTLTRIPRGQTRSYAWVAKQIGNPRATRAVGAACGANPVPIIVPCHRVIASDGSIGGFSSGLRLKRRLLKLEGIQSSMAGGL